MPDKQIYRLASVPFPLKARSIIMELIHADKSFSQSNQPFRTPIISPDLRMYIPAKKSLDEDWHLKYLSSISFRVMACNTRCKWKIINIVVPFQQIRQIIYFKSLRYNSSPSIFKGYIQNSSTTHLAQNNIKSLFYIFLRNPLKSF